MSKRYIREERLQQDLFTKHWNQCIEERGLLFAVNNNSHNKIKGARNKSIGVVPGVSDLIYLNPRETRPQFLEVKVNGRPQSEAQKEWEAKVRALGFQYEVIESVTDFNIVTNLNLV